MRHLTLTASCHRNDDDFKMPADPATDLAELLAARYINVERVTVTPHLDGHLVEMDVAGGTAAAGNAAYHSMKFIVSQLGDRQVCPSS
jgi:hypothetical protein